MSDLDQRKTLSGASALAGVLPLFGLAAITACSIETSVIGTVTDESGVPLQGVAVELDTGSDSPDSALTSVDGTYSLRVKEDCDAYSCDGTYARLSASLADYRDIQVPDLPRDETTVVDLRMPEDVSEAEDEEAPLVRVYRTNVVTVALPAPETVDGSREQGRCVAAIQTTARPDDFRCETDEGAPVRTCFAYRKEVGDNRLMCPRQYSESGDYRNVVLLSSAEALPANDSSGLRELPLQLDLADGTTCLAADQVSTHANGEQRLFDCTARYSTLPAERTLVGRPTAGDVWTVRAVELQSDGSASSTVESVHQVRNVFK